MYNPTYVANKDYYYIIIIMFNRHVIWAPVTMVTHLYVSLACAAAAAAAARPALLCACSRAYISCSNSTHVRSIS